MNFHIHTDIKHKTILRAMLIFASILLMMKLSVFSTDVKAEENIDYITTRAELMKALSDKQEVIHVGDIDFDENDIYISITQSVKFIGKPEGSVLRKGTFLIEGPEVESELITVSFENITFDGCYQAPSGNPNEAPSFEEFHGKRDGKGCFTAKGYLDLEFSDCTIKNYCTKYGAGMYLQYTDGNEDLGTRAKLTMKNCTFTENTCERGVFWCNGKNTALEMSDCTFTANRTYTSVVVLGGVIGTAEGVTVKDNIRVIFKEKNSFPQGGGGIALAKSEITVKNCIIDGNSAPKGGGIMVSGSKATIADCRIINNTSDTFGGGMVIESSEQTSVYVTNCLISGNKAEEEGAVWVYPSDQIGVGLPTGIVEFSFCTFENNTSNDNEHLIFHPVMLENEGSTVGKDGKIDFIACRIVDPKVTVSLKNGENYNKVNSDKTGASIPPDVLGRIANGYYAGTVVEMYPGVNETKNTAAHSEGSKANTDKQNLVVAIVAICAALLAGTAFFILKANDRKKSEAAMKLLKERKTPPAVEEKPAKNEQETLENYINTLAREKSLTDREADVLREYLSGKNRTEISQTLFISESTVKNHISNIFSKLGVKNKNELLQMLNAH